MKANRYENIENSKFNCFPAVRLVICNYRNCEMHSHRFWFKITSTYSILQKYRLDMRRRSFVKILYTRSLKQQKTFIIHENFENIFIRKRTEPKFTLKNHLRLDFDSLWSPNSIFFNINANTNYCRFWSCVPHMHFYMGTFSFIPKHRTGSFDSPARANGLKRDHIWTGRGTKGHRLAVRRFFFYCRLFYFESALFMCAYAAAKGLTPIMRSEGRFVRFRKVNGIF